VKIEPRKRPDVVHGSTYKTKTAYGTLYVTINQDEKGEPFEVFAQMGKAGGFFAAKVEAISRLISLALRSGISVDKIIEQLKGIRGPSPIWTENGTILSLPDAISKVLEKHLNRSQMTMDFNTQSKKPASHNVDKSNFTIADMGDAPACPECGSILQMGEGCLVCPTCGFSKCG
ncbi:MAG: TSCPD domain-containing protein, partial [Patescibacteria group bacterium]|nr:TSCPD domain-containing protein [Patescibacteria group bacterium]